MNLLDEYHSYITDTINCADNRYHGHDSWNNIHYYYPSARIKTWGSTPTFTCPKGQAYTVSDTSHGNGASKYPVTLITMDEATFAGLVLWNWAGDNGNYLHTGTNYWTNSSYSYDSNRGAYPGNISSNGRIDESKCYFYMGIRPVISLKPSVMTGAIGNGTWDNPYVII